MRKRGKSFMIKWEKRMNCKSKMKIVAAVEYKIYLYASQKAKRAAPAALWRQRSCPAPTGEPCPIHSTLNPWFVPCVNGSLVYCTGQCFHLVFDSDSFM